MSRRFQLAMIGSGNIAATAHVPAALQSSSVEIGALVDVSVPNAERLAREFGLACRVVSSIAEVAGSIDGAVIATPNHTHHALALQCLKLGVPVLIEKPLAASVADGEQIVAAAREAALTAAVGYCTRFWDNTCILEEQLAAGAFGRVRRFVYQLGMSNWEPPLTQYSFSRKSAGGGVVIVNGSHFVDRMLSWWGAPDASEYWDDSLGGPEANAVVAMRWTGRELSGRIRLSKSMPLPSGLVLETDGGVVIMPENSTAPLVVRREGGELETSLRRPGGLRCRDDLAAFQCQLEDFVAACGKGSAPKVTAEEGLQSLRFIDALYRQRQPLSW